MKRFILLALLASASASAFAYPPGGFIKSQNSTTVTAPLTATQIAAFLPSTRTSFTFPAPWNSKAVRVTLPSDCPSSTNCVNYIGYSIWANMNNSAGSPYLYIFVGLNAAGGGSNGIKIYRYDKDKDIMTKYANIPSPQTGVTWSWSRTDPNRLNEGTSGYDSTNYVTYDLATNTQTTQWSLSDWIGKPSNITYFGACDDGAEDIIVQCTVANSSYQTLGVMTHNAVTGKFTFYAPPTSTAAGKETYHQSHIDLSGRYVISEQSTPFTCPSCSLDSVILDLQEPGRQQILLNKLGGAGHLGPGWGWVIENDNFNATYQQTKLWDLNDLWGHDSGSAVISQPYSTICNPTCSTGLGDHPTWLNAKNPAVVPLSHQYGCDSILYGVPPDNPNPFSDQIACFSVAPNQKQSALTAVVVAPVMSYDNATGCGSSEYANEPKGNIDYTGHYFIWSSNLDSNTNCQVFLSILPVGLLPYPPPDVTPPESSVVTPAASSTISGTISLTAHAWDNTGVVSVQWYVDGTSVGSAQTVSPYTVSYDTSGLASGPHTISAVAKDAAGNVSTDSQILVVK